MDAVALAARFRLFMETLFTGRLVVELRRELDECRKERDYFKGRAERLELVIAAPRTAVKIAQGTEAPHVHPLPVGRKSWRQIQKDHREKLAEQAIEDAKARQKKSAEVRPN